eukprot:jgi/Chlat1/7160/Chrsp57S06825
MAAAMRVVAPATVVAAVAKPGVAHQHAAGRTGLRSQAFAGVALPAPVLKKAVPSMGAAARQQRLAVTMQAVEAPVKPEMSEVEIWTGNKRLQTQIAEVAQDITTIRSLDWDRDRFDIEFGLQEGTTYNSYIIRGDKLAVVDASHEKFKDLYMACLEERIDVSTIDYIIVSHTEPDHSGLIPYLLERAPDATVVGSKVCIQFLKNLVHRPFKSQVVGMNDKIDLGGGHLLEFVIAPNLHWPDTMFTYDHGTKTIFTCDAFGMHYASDAVFDEDLSTLESHFRFYYDCLMRPNFRSVLTALRKVKDMEFTTIATGHGPLLRYNVQELVGRYKTWSEGVSKGEASVAVLYTTDYGYSDRLSQALARGITKANAAVEMADLRSVETQELVELVGRSAAIVVMAPPRTGPAQEALGTLLAACKSKQKVVIAESYGGDDEPVDTLNMKFIGLEVEPACVPLKVTDTPTEADYQRYEETGTDLGQLLTKKKAIADVKGMNPEVAKALARVSGGLYVVTAARGSSRGAMIASWVSQASFKPLGLTIAVAKDRAIESLMQVGDKFVLNCLEESSYAPLMKHFLKRFPPGADRFEGVDYTVGQNGSPILSEALAFMECTVKSRMEAADHWIVYAEVSEGGVSRPDGRTAAHHRKIANYY